MIREWLELCCTGVVMRRAIKYAIGVGAVLIAINHGDAILEGEIGGDRWLRMGLTVLVPYFVSAFSSAGAIREHERKQRSPAGP